MDAQYVRMQTFNCLATTQNESDKTQITFRKEKDHNGMVRTNHCEPNKYELVGCVCKALDNDWSRKTSKMGLKLI